MTDNQDYDITELDSIKECIKNPLFYITFIVFSIWGIYASPWPTIFVIPLALTLSSLTFIDIKHMILPDAITIGSMLVAFALHVFISGNIFISALAALIGFIVFFLIFYISYKIKGVPSMGFGDVKLLAMLGAWVGISGLPLVLLYATGLAFVFIIFKTIIAKSFTNNPFPFGPFLAVGGWFTFLYHDATWAVILSFRETIISLLVG